MILATLRDLARTLHCRPDQAEEVVRSDLTEIQMRILRAIKFEMDCANAAFDREMLRFQWRDSGFTEAQLQPRIYR